MLGIYWLAYYLFKLIPSWTSFTIRLDKSYCERLSRRIVRTKKGRIFARRVELSPANFGQPSWGKWEIFLWRWQTAVLWLLRLPHSSQREVRHTHLHLSIYIYISVCLFKSISLCICTQHMAHTFVTSCIVIYHLWQLCRCSESSTSIYDNVVVDILVCSCALSSVLCTQKWFQNIQIWPHSWTGLKLYRVFRNTSLPDQCPLILVRR